MADPNTPPADEPRARTWQDVIDDHATYGDVSASYATYEDLLNGTRRDAAPTDEDVDSTRSGTATAP